MIAKQNEKYKNSWVAINSFIDETCLAAFIAGLSHPYFGYMQAARPESLEDSYAFLCKFKSHESTAINMNTGKVPENNKFFGKSSHDLYPSSSQTTRRETNNSVRSGVFKQNTNKTNHMETNFPVPMETESTRTRLTLNKKGVNSNERASKTIIIIVNKMKT